MTVRQVGRRFFLLGGAGAALAIPALPSLLTDSRAQAQASEAPRRFMALYLPHGGVWGERFWPADSAASEPFEISGMHTAHHGRLSALLDGDHAVLSPSLRARADRLTPRLISKMNLLRGLDVPFYVGHGRHNLGCYGPISLDGDIGLPDQATIDQVMAYSRSFYPRAPRKRTIYLGPPGLSVEWVNPSTRSGGYQLIPSEMSSYSLFEQIFVEPSASDRRSVVDRVYESYRRLESGTFGAARRLGGEDRRRLRDYMERLDEIRASMQAGVSAACGTVARPEIEAWASSGAQAGRPEALDWYTTNIYHAYIDTIVAAFLCDSSRIAILNTADDWNPALPGSGGFHEVAHAATTDPTLAEMLRVTSQTFFERVFVDVVSKLDGAIESDGRSVLDNSLVFWTHESGPITHDNDSTPVVAAGSAGGFFRTGNYVDYRNRDVNPVPMAERVGGHVERRLGIGYFQWLTTCLDAMRIPREEWQDREQVAFAPLREQGPGQTHPERNLDRIRQLCDERLPIIT